MNRRILQRLTVALLCSFAAWGAGSKTYVDCGGGDDRADGLTSSTAWRSLRAVSARVFKPGDSILFRRGSVCRGLLAPQGSGTVNAPITLSAYGSGVLPRIVAEAGQPAAFQLLDQQYWTVEHLEFSGGDPHGVFVSGTSGVLRGIHIRDVVVHSVTGYPKTKEGGLLVIAPGSDRQRFEDILVDGVTAYGTSQWAGILVGGVNHGYLPEAARSSNVRVRNSIVHDVSGDGIVLFQVNHGTLENNVAWFTGLQGNQSIGTPNAIWTWMCRGCTVRRNEAFLTDSPGVDGGAFDIDYGSDDTLVEENYGHDTQGYCVGIFGYGWLTSNSVFRNNTCVDNGRSPRLAIQQGAIYFSTSNAGKLKGLEISGNLILWNPPAAAAALVDNAEFIGKGSVTNNVIRSTSPFTLPTDSALVMSRNSIEPYGLPPAHLVSAERVPAFSLRDAAGLSVTVPEPGRWTLLAFVTAGAGRQSSRGLIAQSLGIQLQFPNLAVRIVVCGNDLSTPEARENIRYDWNTGRAPVLFEDGTARPASFVLLDPQGRLTWRQESAASPAQLGLAIRELVGLPHYSELVPAQ